GGDANEPGLERIIGALSEPAAVATTDGRIQAANGAWKTALGAGSRLPKNNASAASLFSALAAARRGETARAAIRVQGAEHDAVVAPLGGRRFLIRLIETAPADALSL